MINTMEGDNGPLSPWLLRTERFANTKDFARNNCFTGYFPNIQVFDYVS